MANKIAPYTVKEKLLLANLIDKYKLVENKKTDAATIQKKNEEWAKIAEEYNSRGDIITQSRNFLQLKKLWNNLKQRKRKATTQLKYERLATGGGPEPNVDIDPVMEAVDVAAPFSDVTVECEWDSTAYYEKQFVYKPSAKDITEPSSGTADTPNISLVETNSTIISPNNTLTTTATPNISKKSKTSNSNSKNSKLGLGNLNTEAELRIKKMQDAIQQQAELHKLRVQIEEEQLKTAVASKEKVEAERDLAVIQLKIFKAQNNL